MTEQQDFYTSEQYQQMTNTNQDRLEKHLCEMILCGIRIVGLMVENDSIRCEDTTFTPDIVFNSMMEAQTLGNGLTLAHAYICALLGTDYAITVYRSQHTFMHDLTLPPIGTSFGVLFKSAKAFGYKGNRLEFHRAYNSLNLGSGSDVPPSIKSMVRAVLSQNFVEFFEPIIKTSSIAFKQLNLESPKNAQAYLQILPPLIRANLEID